MVSLDEVTFAGLGCVLKRVSVLISCVFAMGGVDSRSSLKTSPWEPWEALGRHLFLVRILPIDLKIPSRATLDYSRLFGATKRVAPRTSTFDVPYG